MPSPIREHIKNRLSEQLDEHRVVVWYDPAQEMASVFDAFQRLEMEKVDARTSVLDARRRADAAFHHVANPDPPGRTPTLLIYVPWTHGRIEEEKIHEPFEAYATIGTAFGVDQKESLDSFARQAMPGREADVDRLCAQGRKPSLDELEALAEEGGFPLLKKAFGTEDAVEVGARILTAPEQARAAIAAAGVKDDLSRLLREAFGFPGSIEPATLQAAFGRWVLFSEFALDVEDRVPPHTAQVPRAAGAHRTAIYRLCNRLRDSDEWREAYMNLANEIEQALQLGGIAQDVSPWGERDTFAAEDSAALRYVQAECLAGRLDVARRTLELRKRSIWLHEPPRNQLWQLAGRCVDLLLAAQAFRERAVSGDRPVREHVLAYKSSEDGLWKLDRCQRWMERAAGDCAEREVLLPLLDHTRMVYRKTIDAAQDAFLQAVARDGWPPEGPLQIQVYAQHVAPAVQSGAKVAYFLLDALRFEMGLDLKKTLEKLGVVHVEAVASVIPTTTPFGMAALVPGADTSFGAAVLDGELVPTVGGRAVATVDDRRERFREQLGDRCLDMRLDELLDATDAKIRERVGRVDLFVVRSDDIDKAGEGTNLPSARRFMSSILDDVTRVAQRLARAGVTRMVFCADHGHVLVPGIPPGDVVRPPDGEWMLKKRRSRLGSAAGSADGVRVFPAGRLGIHGPIKDVAVATGFRVFTEGAAYFHEGVSLQECLVPLLTLSVSGATRGEFGTTHVDVGYRHERFTQRIFMVTLKLSSLVQREVDVRVIAIAKGKSRPVGQAADCEARDPATGLIHLRHGAEEKVVIRIDDDFTGPDVEIQVLDAAGAGVLLGSKTLKNAGLV